MTLYGVMVNDNMLVGVAVVTFSALMTITALTGIYRLTAAFFLLYSVLVIFPIVIRPKKKLIVGLGSITIIGISVGIIIDYVVRVVM